MTSTVASGLTSPRRRERRQRVQAAETCLAVLKALATLGGRASLTAIAGAVEESPAKVHRYLASLMAEGLVEQDRGGTQYALAAEAMRVGLAAMRQSDPIRLAEPALLHLREALQVTSFVAVMGNLGPTIVRFEEPGLPVTVNVRVGSVMSLLWSATGRAFFAFMDDDARVDALLAGSWPRRRPRARAARWRGPAGHAAPRDPRCGLRLGARCQPAGHQRRGGAAARLHGPCGGRAVRAGRQRRLRPGPAGRCGRALRAEAARVSASLGHLPGEARLKPG